VNTSSDTKQQESRSADVMHYFPCLPVKTANGSAVNDERNHCHLNTGMDKGAYEDAKKGKCTDIYFFCN